MWSHFASSVTINYIGKKGRPFWGLTSGKEKCYWPVKSLLLEHAEPDSQFSVCCYLLKGHFLASVRRSPSIVYLSPFFCLLSKEKLAILENLFAITSLLAATPPTKSTCSQTKHYQQTRINVPCIQLQPNTCAKTFGSFRFNRMVRKYLLCGTYHNKM